MKSEIKSTKSLCKKEIPSDWKVKSLGEVATFVNGKAYKQEELLSEGKYKVLRVGNFFTKGDWYFSDLELEEDKYVSDGDLMYAWSASFGPQFWRGEKTIYHYHIWKVIPSNLVTKEFLFFLLDYDTQRILNSKQGGTMFHITKGDMEKRKSNIPSLPEQKAIARVLCTADAAIHSTEQLIAQKELRKKWLMEQLLTGKKRLKGFGGLWQEVHLGEMFVERNETKYIDLPLLSIGQNGVYPQNESIKKDTSNEDKSKYKRICPGDIGYNTMRMWQGRSALSNLEGIVSPAYTVITPKKNTDSLFFSYLFKMPKMTNLFWRNSQGLVDDTLNCKFKDFSIVKMLLPQTKEEQSAIAGVLQIADNEIKLLREKADKLREQKKGLMQQLLVGKKRLKYK